MLMKVFGKPEFLNLYFRHFAPYLRGINISAWDLSLHLLPPEDMPSGMQGATRDRFVPPGDAYISLPEVEGVSLDMLFRSKVPVIGHEIGHFIHTVFMGEDGSGQWKEFATLTKAALDFSWRTTNLGAGRHPYPHVPAYEIFADTFRDWLMGQRLEMEAFYMGLWGQEAKATPDQIKIFKSIMQDTGPAGREALTKHLELFNPRALVYLYL